MQEGTSSLMQMAKVSVAVEALHNASIPFISVLNDPTFGGVSASYAMQADVKIATTDARIGFAGPAVILNTMCDADQAKYDATCPADFQSAEYVLEHGQIDMIVDGKALGQAGIEQLVADVAARLLRGRGAIEGGAGAGSEAPVDARDKEQPFNYIRSRNIDRPQAGDIISNVFDSFLQLSGDGRVGRDICIRGGLATFGASGRSCVVVGTFKGHTPQTMQDANYGMGSPHGYRTALRLMRLAERFKLPVVTLVDTVGAWPTFGCEGDGQSEAIATNLTAMAGLTVPIVTLLVGEGGSGGALGVGMGNIVGMLSGGYFGVISPEGAASILGRYRDEAHKAAQFPLDCQALATAQCIYADQLQELGVVDEIIWELAPDLDTGASETFRAFPVLKARIQNFLANSLARLGEMSVEEVVAHRYEKFRKLGTYQSLDEAGRAEAVRMAKENSTTPKRAPKVDTSASPLIKHLSELVVTSSMSRFRGLAPASCPLTAPAVAVPAAPRRMAPPVTAKTVLDSQGPEAMAQWVKSQTKVLITDTTMRDAHQSLIATRARTEDLVKGAALANALLSDAFSFEAWGGATFDVCMRFLDEDPWERLREIRAACPDVCLQMLIRGANAVGYTSYPDNVVTEFCRLAAENGMDVFRIFDCFNVMDNMRVAIDAVRAAGKVAEVCLCYTGDVLTSSIYDLNYYRDLAKEATEAGAHIIAVKDMAGLLRPREAGPLLRAIREVTDLPIHFHTHATSSGSLATCYEMAREGCDIIDFCTASMADGTSQPSLNAFVAMMEGAPNATGFNFLDLEPYDVYWARVRDMYAPFESGMKSGSARVFEHQIPGGQYSNLIVQCQSMGLWDRWEEVLDAYRDVNRLFGEIVKVTPSSKCVGDLALYLVTRQLTTSDLLDPAKAAQVDFPESVVGLMKGELGFPHRGFPALVEQAILKGAPKLSVRAGLALPSADFEANRAALSTAFGTEISPEQAMSSLMYPKVFSDFMKRQQSRGGALLRLLPSPVYFYGLLPGQTFSLTAPAALAAAGLGVGVGAESASPFEGVAVTVELKRVSALKEGKRSVVWAVNGAEQICEVKDNSGKFVYSGPMADPAATPRQLGSPMPGIVEKLLVREGQAVAAGDVLCTVSAMKMEVKVTAPGAGVVAGVAAPVGTRVVEGALLISLTLA